jgi:hypothetical protein
MASLAILQLLSFSAYCQLSSSDSTGTVDIWSEINETTWFEENGWAGQSYVFYEDSLGNKRCIFQIHGSGVYVVSRDFIEIQLVGIRMIKIGDNVYELGDSSMVAGSSALALFSNEPLVYDRLKPVNIALVKSSRFNVRNIDGNHTVEDE